MGEPVEALASGLATSSWASFVCFRDAIGEGRLLEAMARALAAAV